MSPVFLFVKNINITVTLNSFMKFGETIQGTITSFRIRSQSCEMVPCIETFSSPPVMVILRAAHIWDQGKSVRLIPPFLLKPKHTWTNRGTAHPCISSLHPGNTQCTLPSSRAAVAVQLRSLAVVVVFLNTSLKGEYTVS
ncbi:hypothetical protein BaRGS_00025065 [Batillaria attramentaria]|uniref:Uncharacterized protein n=1 Tax=Batillaria attramentaria TaxID=370345 RepID=A0ABD0K9B4_9CAEN